MSWISKFFGEENIGENIVFFLASLCHYTCTHLKILSFITWNRSWNGYSINLAGIFHEEMILPFMKIRIVEWFRHVSMSVCISLSTYINHLSNISLCFYFPHGIFIFVKEWKKMHNTKSKLQWKEINLCLLDMRFYVFIWFEAIKNAWDGKLPQRNVMPGILRTNSICRWLITLWHILGGISAHVFFMTNIMPLLENENTLSSPSK